MDLNDSKVHDDKTPIASLGSQNSLPLGAAFAEQIDQKEKDKKTPQARHGDSKL